MSRKKKRTKIRNELTISTSQERISQNPESKIVGEPGAKKTVAAAIPDEVAVGDIDDDGAVSGEELERHAAVLALKGAVDAISAVAVGPGAGELRRELADKGFREQGERRA